MLSDIVEINDREGYGIDRIGNVYTRWRVGGNVRKARLVDEWKLITASLHENGYYRLTLKGKHIYPHQQVAVTFIGPRPVGHVVRHLNGNPLDNRLENLAYGTHKENSQDMVSHGGVFKAKNTTWQNSPLNKLLISELI